MLAREFALKRREHYLERHADAHLLHVAPKSLILRVGKDRMKMHEWRTLFQHDVAGRTHYLEQFVILLEVIPLFLKCIVAAGNVLDRTDGREVRVLDVVVGREAGEGSDDLLALRDGNEVRIGSFMVSHVRIVSNRQLLLVKLRRIT